MPAAPRRPAIPSGRRPEHRHKIFPLDYSKADPTRFDPQGSEHRRKLWVRVSGVGPTYYHVYWGRLAAAMATLAVLGWLIAAGGVWVFVKFQRGYSGVPYHHIAFYPWRRAEYRKGLGEHYIASGRIAWNQQNYREAYALLIAGLARVPEDTQARRYVATIEGRIGRMDRAVRTLSDGVKYAGDDLDYLKLLFGVLLDQQKDDQIISLTSTLLPEQPDDTLIHQFTALQAATAHYHRGRLGDAVQLIRTWKLQNSLEGLILLSRCDRQQGLDALAEARLEWAINKFADRDELYLELVRLNRDLGHHGDARRYALLRQFNSPDSAGARIDLLHTYRTSGDAPAEQRELELYFTKFSADANALLLLAWFATDTAQPAVAERIYRLVRELKIPLAGFNLARVQTYLAAKDYPRTIELAEAAIKPDQNPNDYMVSLISALRAVAHFGAGEPTRGQVMLKAFLENARVRANDALLLARQFKTIGFLPQARTVLERACELDPSNEPALAELIRLQAEEGDRAALAENIPKLFAMRKHFRGALEQTLKSLNGTSDAPLRRQIEQALAQPAAPVP